MCILIYYIYKQYPLLISWFASDYSLEFIWFWVIEYNLVVSICMIYDPHFPYIFSLPLFLLGTELLGCPFYVLILKTSFLWERIDSLHMFKIFYFKNRQKYGLKLFKSFYLNEITKFTFVYFLSLCKKILLKKYGL